MKNLSQQISSYSNPENFRVTAVLPASKSWSHENWTPKDDASLLIGVHRYGFGKWDEITKDKSLNLGSKKITSAQYKSRVESLFKALRLERMNQSNILRILSNRSQNQNARNLKRRRRRTRDLVVIKWSGARIQNERREIPPGTPLSEWKQTAKGIAV